MRLRKKLTASVAKLTKKTGKKYTIRIFSPQDYVEVVDYKTGIVEFSGSASFVNGEVQLQAFDVNEIFDETVE